MCELLNSHYDIVFVKLRALIDLEAVSKSYLCIEKLTSWNGFVFGWSNVPLYATTFKIIFAFIWLVVDKNLTGLSTWV
jgi:hypothetical protein